MEHKRKIIITSEEIDELYKDRLKNWSDMFEEYEKKSAAIDIDDPNESIAFSEIHTAFATKLKKSPLKANVNISNKLIVSVPPLDISLKEHSNIAVKENEHSKPSKKSSPKTHVDNKKKKLDPTIDNEFSENSDCRETKTDNDTKNMSMYSLSPNMSKYILEYQRSKIFFLSKSFSVCKKQIKSEVQKLMKHYSKEEVYHYTNHCLSVSHKGDIAELIEIKMKSNISELVLKRWELKSNSKSTESEVEENFEQLYNEYQRLTKEIEICDVNYYCVEVLKDQCRPQISRGIKKVCK